MSFDENISLPSEPATEIAGEASPAPPYHVSANRIVQEDLRVPWGWVDLLIFVLICLLGGLLLAVGFAMVASWWTHAHAGAPRIPAVRASIEVVISAVLDLCVLAYLAAQMRIRFQSPVWRTLGWRPLETGGISRGLAYGAFALGGLFLGFVTSLVGSLVPPGKTLPIQHLFQDRDATLLLMLMSITVAPVVEETVFRGYIYPVVARSWGIGAGVAVTGTLFGLLHARQLWGGPWQIAALVFVGIALTMVRASTRTVVASCIVHASYNSFQVIALVIGTQALRHLPPMR
jgi:uncharacterized protein